MPSQLTSVRLDETQLAYLRLLAEVDGSNVAEIIRRAIVAYAKAEFQDPSFRARVEESNARRAELLAEFAG